MSEKVNAPEISVKNVSMVFSDSKGNPVQALKNVSIDIQKGEFISLLGPSGCGKSTLLRIVSDLLTPTSGEVTVCGKTPRETRLEQKFGIVFQNPVLLDWRTVRKNIRLPLEMMKVPKEEQASRIEQVLELVGLKEFGNSYPGQLSGGMQQRVGIARALAIQPDILLMAITASILVDTLQGGNGLGCMLSQSLKGSMTRFVFWDIVIFSAVIGVLSFYLMGVIERATNPAKRKVKKKAQ